MDLAPRPADIEGMGIVNGGRGKETLRCIAAVVAMVLVPSLAPDTFGLACPHHAGHGGDHGGDEAHNTRQPMAQGGSLGMGAAPAMSGHGGHSPQLAPRLDDASHGADSHDLVSQAADSPDAGPPPCTCAGQCPVSGAPPAPGAGVRVVAEAALESISTEVEPAPLLSTPTPFVLPFATAPPIA